MYRRYSQTGEGAAGSSRRFRNRLKNLLIILLLLALIGLSIWAVPALRDRESNRSSLIQRIQTECGEAIRQTSTLSRNAGADSASILARVRSNVYAIRTLNALGNSSGFGYLVSEESVMTIQNLVDRYLTYITTGMDTGEYQTSLQNALTELQNAVQSLN